MKVSEITEILDNWMPISIAEDFDNVGLIVGDLNSEVKNILVTLDTTQNVVDEALDKDCNLIISYHPIIFNDLKKITTDSGYVQKVDN
jgi:putative NIF3 family GTP cyclohydrolase 1 type 2